MFKFNKDFKDLKQVEPFFKDFEKECLKLKEKNQYPYNDLFKGKIKGIKGEDEERAIFLLQSLKRKKEKEKLKDKMITGGWLELTEEVIKEAIEKKKKVKLSAKTTCSWMTFSVEKTLKPKYFNGKYGLMELKARTKGYGIKQFEDAFCKLV